MDLTLSLLRSSYLKFQPQKSIVERDGDGRSNAFPPHTSHKHPISQLIRDISLKDDMTVFLPLGVSFMSITLMLFSSHLWTVHKALLILSIIVLHSTWRFACSPSVFLNSLIHIILVIFSLLHWADIPQFTVQYKNVQYKFAYPSIFY